MVHKLLGLVLGAGFAAGFAQPAEIVKKGPGWSYTRLGNTENVTTKTRFGMLLGGGGTDVDAAFQWMCERSGNGDFLVLRASGTPAYNSYISGLCPGINSVATLNIESRAAANDPFVLTTIRKAEAVFLSGGDQANYVNFWEGTGVQQAINAMAANGVPIGGTSAGNAVLGQFAFSALHDTVTSSQALSDPFSPLITIDDHFLRLSPLLRNTITDDHFVTRDRMGRLIVFLAHLMRDTGAPVASAIAVADKTALLIEQDGSATVAGPGDVYFFRSRHKAELFVPGKPLTFLNVSVARMSAHATFNLKRWQGTGGVRYEISAVNGVLQSTQAGGSIY